MEVGRECPATRACPEGSVLLKTQNCPTRVCLGNATVEIGRPCPPTKTCPDDKVVVETQQCGTKLCPGNAIVDAGADCPATQVCPDETILLTTATCPTKRCPNETIIPSTENCPAPVIRAEEGTGTSDKICQNGQRVPAAAICTKRCSDDAVVQEDLACPPEPFCLKCLFLPLTSDTAPNWAALAAVVVLLGGAAPAVKWYKEIQHQRLIAKTAALLSVSSELDPSDGAFRSNGLKVDGPSIRLQTYLDPWEP